MIDRLLSVTLETLIFSIRSTSFVLDQLGVNRKYHAKHRRTR